MRHWPVGLRNTLLIARRQLGAIRQDGYVVFLLGLVIALGLVAALGARHYAANETEQRDRYQAMVDRQWVEQPERHPHRVIHYGFLVFREQAPLEFFDPGVSDYAGTSLYLEGHRQNTANFGEARHATGMSRLGRLTPASVLALLLPLLVVVAGFAAVSAEREGGTLGVLLTQGATPTQILAGKVLATGAVGALATFPVALAVAVMAGPGLESPASVTRLGALAAIYAVYLAGWVLVTVLVSAVRTSSRSALAQLLALWVVICIAAPRMAASVAGALYPLPSRAELTAQVEQALNEVGDSHRPDDPFFRSLREEYLERYQVGAVEDLPVNWRGVLSRESEALSSRVFEDHRQELVKGHLRQNGVLAWSGFLSPYLAARDLSMGIAGSGPEATEAFLAQAEAHRYTIIQRLNELHISEIRLENDRAQRLSREHWEEFPVFDTEPPPLGGALENRSVSLAALGLWIGLPLTGLGLARRRLALVGTDRSS
jgi:ABC-2 type transport system permease protein